MYLHMTHNDFTEILVDPKKFPCGHCEKQFSSKRRCMLHEKSCKAPQDKTCQHCSKTFSSFVCYQKHEKNCAGKFDISCLYFIHLIDTHLDINSHVSLRV